MNDKELIAEARKLLFSDSELGYEYTGGGGLIYRLADALEVALAARQSSGDTCEDDRETLDKVITEYDMALYTKEETLDRLASRAAVPDAATERELEAVKEHREKWMARAFSAEAERDAALAAIERVRSINTGNNRALYGNDFEAGMAKALWLVKAALDGAPEPEEIAEQDAAVAAIEQDECTLPGHAGCTRVMVDGELWIDHFPSERGADTDGDSK